MSDWRWNDSGDRATYEVDTDTYINMPVWFKDKDFQRRYEENLLAERDAGTD